MSPLTTPFQYCTGVLANTIRQEKEIKDIQIWKEEIELSFLTWLCRKSETINKKTPGTNPAFTVELQDTRLIYKWQSLSYMTVINKWNLKLKT